MAFLQSDFDITYDKMEVYEIKKWNKIHEEWTVCAWKDVLIDCQENLFLT